MEVGAMGDGGRVRVEDNIKILIMMLLRTRGSFCFSSVAQKTFAKFTERYAANIQ